MYTFLCHLHACGSVREFCNAYIWLFTSFSYILTHSAGSFGNWFFWCWVLNPTTTRLATLICSLIWCQPEIKPGAPTWQENMLPMSHRHVPNMMETKLPYDLEMKGNNCRQILPGSTRRIILMLKPRENKLTESD